MAMTLPERLGMSLSGEKWAPVKNLVRAGYFDVLQLSNDGWVGMEIMYELESALFPMDEAH